MRLVASCALEYNDIAVALGLGDARAERLVRDNIAQLLCFEWLPAPTSPRPGGEDSGGTSTPASDRAPSHEPSADAAFVTSEASPPADRVTAKTPATSPQLPRADAGGSPSCPPAAAPAACTAASTHERRRSGRGGAMASNPFGALVALHGDGESECDGSGVTKHGEVTCASEAVSGHATLPEAVHSADSPSTLPPAPSDTAALLPTSASPGPPAGSSSASSPPQQPLRPPTSTGPLHDVEFFGLAPPASGEGEEVPRYLLWCCNTHLFWDPQSLRYPLPPPSPSPLSAASYALPSSGSHWDSTAPHARVFCISGARFAPPSLARNPRAHLFRVLLTPLTHQPVFLAGSSPYSLAAPLCSERRQVLAGLSLGCSLRGSTVSLHRFLALIFMLIPPPPSPPPRVASLSFVSTNRMLAHDVCVLPLLP